MEQGGTWWKAVFYGLPVSEIVLMGCCLYRLTAPFMERKKGALRAGMAYVLVMWGIYVLSLRLEGLSLRRMMGALAVFLVMCRTDRRNYGQKAFLVQTFFSLHRFAGAVAEMVYDNLYYFIGNTDYMRRIRICPLPCMWECAESIWLRSFCSWGSVSGLF